MLLPGKYVKGKKLKNTLDIFQSFVIIALVPARAGAIAGLCKGSTTDSDSVCEGSNPSPAAKYVERFRCRGLNAYGIKRFRAF